VALNFGGEAFVSTDKQAYQDNNILFTTGDYAYVNGETKEVEPVGTGATARIWADATSTGSYEVHYPVSTVRYDAATSSWKTTFLRDITLIPAMGNTNITNGGYQVWPMSGYVDDINAVAEGYQFKLYNNVAVISPAVKYGPNFAEAMWSAGGIDSLGWVRDENNLPTLTITKVVLSSSQIRLTGDATLQNPTADDAAVLGGQTTAPYFLMDNAPADDSIVATVTGTGFVAVPTTASSTGVNIVIFGNIPVAPYPLMNRTMTVAFYFNATVNGTTHYYKYTGSFTTQEGNTWLRSRRTTLIADFYNPDVATLTTKIEVL